MAKVPVKEKVPGVVPLDVAASAAQVVPLSVELCNDTASAAPAMAPRMVALPFWVKMSTAGVVTARDGLVALKVTVRLMVLVCVASWLLTALMVMVLMPGVRVRF